jgi:hypothetical protein
MEARKDKRRHVALNPQASRHNVAVMSFLFLVAAGVAVMLYQQSHAGVRPHLQWPFPAKLSAWRLFVGRAPELHPNHGMVPYDINTPLFSDYALKHHFVWMPPGTSATYGADDVFDFPVGTIFSKTFAFPAEGHAGAERLIETRLLVRTASRRGRLPYVWNEAQTEARLDIDADPMPVRFVDAAGYEHSTNYNIPNANQCKECHELKKTMQPLGPNARNLNKTYAYASGAANQLEYWTRVGYLTSAPDAAQAPRAAVWNDPSTGTLEACGRARQPPPPPCTPIWLRLTPNHWVYVSHRWQRDTAQATCCTILCRVSRRNRSSLHRMESTEPKAMMPEITLTHDEGVSLIREWIGTLQVACAAAVPARRRQDEQLKITYNPGSSFIGAL